MARAPVSPLVERIRRQNWDQGCLLEGRRDLFVADLAQPLTPEAERKAAEVGELGIEVVFEVREAEKMIIVSQRCDLVASPDGEPLCEAVPLVAWPDERGLPQANSARRFLIDREQRLVADQSRRFLFEKTLLPDHDAAQLLPDASEWRSFRAWCARRYSRHAFPDDFVETVGRALDWALAKESRKSHGAEAIHSWRALVDDGTTPVSVSLLVPYDELHPQAGKAESFVRAVVESARARLPKELAAARKRAGSGDAVREHMIAGFLSRAFDGTSLRDLRDFDSIDFEHLTFAGTEIKGVEPHEEEW